MRTSGQGRLVLVLVASVLLFSLRAAEAQEQAEAESLEVPRLLIMWNDGHRLYPGTHEGVAREVASIFAPLDLEMRWQLETKTDQVLDDRTILLRVVLMPSDPSGPGWKLDGDVLGAAPPGNGRARSVYIFYKRLVREVSNTMTNPWMRNPPVRLLEKALGRVVAHEMVHAVAPSVRHAKRGLMRPSVGGHLFSGNDLVVSSPVSQAFLAGAEGILARRRDETVDRDTVPLPSNDAPVSHP